MNEFDYDIDSAFTNSLWKCTMRFKKPKAPKYKPPAQPQLSEIGKEAEEKLYGAVERGLAGGGFFPFAGKSYEKLKESYGEAYQTARGELGGRLERLIPKADVGVREHAKGMLSRGYYGGLDELKRQQRAEEYGGQEMALTLGTQYLAEAKKMGVNILDIYNQQQAANFAQQQQYGTFTSNLASGLGSMGGYMAAANYAGRMSGGGFGGGGGFGIQTGATAATNWLQQSAMFGPFG